MPDSLPPDVISLSEHQGKGTSWSLLILSVVTITLLYLPRESSCWEPLEAA